VIVVDTNIIAYFFLPGTFTEKVQKQYELDQHWIAPALWRSEFRNILIGEVRRKTLSLSEAQAVQAEAEALLLGNEYDVSSQRVLTLANSSGCSAYDCEFVALAAERSVLLLTADKKVLKAFPEHSFSLN
jgi:predicted nucleic acid-binding protein